jgi:hypothetical protein
VDTSISVKGTEFLAPNQPVDYRNVTVVDIVYTNPQNDATVLRHAAGPFSETIISGDPEGVHTVERTASGLQGLPRTADGVVVLGAGNLVLHEVFNGEEFVSREIVVNRGPHPNIESDLVLFCEVTTDALGLSQHPEQVAGLRMERPRCHAAALAWPAWHVRDCSGSTG